MLELYALTYYRKMAKIVIILIGSLVGDIPTISLHFTGYADVCIWRYKYKKLTALTCFLKIYFTPARA